MGKLVVEGVSRRFPARGRRPAVAAFGPIDLTVGAGEFVALIGPSGCGKSSLLRILAGLDRPDRGVARMDGAPIAGPGPDRCMMLQQFALFPWLSVRDNIAFGRRRRGGKTAAIVDRLIVETGLCGFEAHYPAALSGGMQQRAALARALAPDPGLLLLDEPFGALDQQTRGLMQEMLARICAGGSRTVVLVTHDIAEAVFLADRICVLTARPGRIKAVLAVDLPRPRAWSVRTSPAFAGIAARVAAALRAEIAPPEPGGPPGPALS